MISKEKVLELSAGFEDAYATSDLEKFDKLAHQFLSGIGARFAEGDAPSFDYISSITQEPSFKLAATKLEEMPEIFARARRSQEIWGKLPVKTRQLFFKLLHQEMGKYAAHFELAVTLDMGKSVMTSKKEMVKADEWCRWAVSPAVRDALFIVTDRKAGKQIDIDQPFPVTNAIDIESREALGLITGMTSLNYLLGLFMGPFTEALVTGSTYVYKSGDKPSVYYIMEKVVEDTLYELRSKIAGDKNVREIFGDAFTDDEKFKDFAAGVFSVAYGTAVAKTIVEEGDHFIFIGGDFGKKCLEWREALGKGDKTTLELGGAATTIIMNNVFEDVVKDDKVILDAMSDEEVADALYVAMTDNNHQRCTGLVNLLIQAGRAEKVIGILVEKVQNEFSIGNPFNTNTKHGPMIYANGDAYMDEYIPKFAALGATEVGGGKMKRNDGFPKTCLRRPSFMVWPREALEDQKVIDLLNEAEAFCPISHIFTFNNLEQAMEFGKKIPRRLAASIYSYSPEEIAKYEAAKLYGEFSINAGPKDLSSISGHGGATPESGKGRLGGTNSLIELTRPGQSSTSPHIYLVREVIMQATGVEVGRSA